MRLFLECLRKGVTTPLGNENFKFGPLRSQPRRDRRKDEEEVPSAKLWRLPLDIKKADPDQNLIFGWASVIEKDGIPIIDHQEDVIPVSELENAVYDFVLHSRQQGDMHDRVGVGKLVESMVFTKEKQEALGIDLKQIGWWTGFKVHDEGLWQAHKSGDRPEFSIGGAAVSIDMDDDIFKWRGK